MNSSWSDEGMILHPDINIGLAVSLGEEGLIVPVLKRADTLGLPRRPEASRDWPSPPAREG